MDYAQLDHVSFDMRLDPTGLKELKDYIHALFNYAIEHKVLLEYTQFQVAWKHFVSHRMLHDNFKIYIHMGAMLQSRTDFFDVWRSQLQFSVDYQPFVSRTDLSDRLQAEFQQGIAVHVIPSQQTAIVPNVINKNYEDLDGLEINAALRAAYSIIERDLTLWPHTWCYLLKMTQGNTTRIERYEKFLSGLPHGDDQTAKVVWACRESLTGILPILTNASFKGFVQFVSDYYTLNTNDEFQPEVIRSFWAASLREDPSLNKGDLSNLEEELWQSSLMDRWWTAFRVRRGARFEMPSEVLTCAALLMSDLAFYVDKNHYAIPTHRLYLNETAVVDFMKQLVFMNGDLPLSSDTGAAKWLEHVTDKSWGQKQIEEPELRTFWEDSGPYDKLLSRMRGMDRTMAELGDRAKTVKAGLEENVAQLQSAAKECDIISDNLEANRYNQNKN